MYVLIRYAAEPTVVQSCTLLLVAISVLMHASSFVHAYCQSQHTDFKANNHCTAVLLISLIYSTALILSLTFPRRNMGHRSNLHLQSFFFSVLGCIALLLGLGCLFIFLILYTVGKTHTNTHLKNKINNVNVW
jgi:hypothetical protein